METRVFSTVIYRGVMSYIAILLLVVAEPDHPGARGGKWMKVVDLEFVAYR